MGLFFKLITCNLNRLRIWNITASMVHVKNFASMIKNNNFTALQLQFFLARILMSMLIGKVLQNALYGFKIMSEFLFTSRNSIEKVCLLDVLKRDKPFNY